VGRVEKERCPSPRRPLIRQTEGIGYEIVEILGHYETLPDNVQDNELVSKFHLYLLHSILIIAQELWYVVVWAQAGNRSQKNKMAPIDKAFARDNVKGVWLRPWDQNHKEASSSILNYWRVSHANLE
jgi:hypothetical protein